MTTSATILSRPVRIRVMGKYLGQLILVMSILTTIPLLAALLFSEYPFAWRYFIIVVFLALVGKSLARIEAPSDIYNNEAILITVLIFVLTALIMTFPLLTAELSFSDALFESISAITTTGLSTRENVTGGVKTLLFARAWMQWVGGLGIVALSFVFVIGPGKLARKLASYEGHGEDIVGSTRSLAQRALVVYSVLTVLCTMLLLAFGVDMYSAISHAFAAVSTGGFSIYDNSLAGLSSSYLAAIILFFSFCGSIPLLLYYDSIQHGWLFFFRNTQFKALVACSLLLMGMMTWSLYANSPMALEDAFTHGVLLAVSAQTTTGFTTISLNNLDNTSQLLLILFMTVGGSLGSTAGGIKLFRLLIFLKFLQVILQRSASPSHAVIEPELQREKLKSEDIEKAFMVILLYITTILLSWLLFVIYGYPGIEALFEVTSATATVGLSTGISRSELEPLLKGVLCFDMLAGRLEIIALLILFYPKNWISH